MQLLRRLSCLLLLFISLAAHAQSPFHVAVSGTGKQSVILIPGFTCPGSVWDETVKELSTKYTCHVITFAGFAGAHAQQDPHLKDWVTSIAGYIKQQHMDKPIVIGHSIGGGMAMMLAAGYPELVSKIVVVDALPCLAALRKPDFKADPNPDCAALVTRFTTMPDSALRKQQVATSRIMSTDSTIREKMIDWSLQSDRKTMGQIFCEFSNTDLRDTLAAVQCPSLIMLEPSFKMFDAAMQTQFAKLKDKQLVYATKGLHFIMYDDQDWYLAQLKAFLL